MIHIDRPQHHTFDRGSQTCQQVQTIYMIRFRYAATRHWLCKYLYINTDKKVNTKDSQKTYQIKYMILQCNIEQKQPLITFPILPIATIQKLQYKY